MGDEATGGQQQGAAGTGSGGEQMVPYSRLQQVIRERDEARAQIQAATDQVTPLQSRLQAIEAEHATAQRSLAMHRAGLHSAEAHGIAEYLHGRLPEQGRPALDQWVSAIVADPASAPLAMRPYLQAATTPAPAAPTAQTPPVDTQQAATAPPAAGAPPTAPRSSATAVPAPAATPDWTPERIAALSPAEFEQRKTEILRATGFRKA